jgi:hypothetical protein
MHQTAKHIDLMLQQRYVASHDAYTETASSVLCKNLEPGLYERACSIAV